MSYWCTTGTQTMTMESWGVMSVCVVQFFLSLQLQDSSEGAQMCQCGPLSLLCVCWSQRVRCACLMPDKLIQHDTKGGTGEVSGGTAPCGLCVCESLSLSPSPCRCVCLCGLSMLPRTASLFFSTNEFNKWNCAFISYQIARLSSKAWSAEY